jgi:hypothetical protein
MSLGTAGTSPQYIALFLQETALLACSAHNTHTRTLAFIKTSRRLPDWLQAL